MTVLAVPCNATRVDSAPWAERGRLTLWSDFNDSSSDQLFQYVYLVIITRIDVIQENSRKQKARTNQVLLQLTHRDHVFYKKQQKTENERISYLRTSLSKFSNNSSVCLCLREVEHSPSTSHPFLWKVPVFECLRDKLLGEQFGAKNVCFILFVFP